MMTYEQWVEKEGGIDKPTKLETIAQRCQQDRINWLVKNSVGSVLEMGCNWGYILVKVCEKTGGVGFGVDLWEQNIAKGTKEFPHLNFFQADITKELSFFWPGQLDTVIIPDTLEHIPFCSIADVLKSAHRLTRDLVLITLPWEESKRTCFKHRWVVSKEKVEEIVSQLRALFHQNIRTFSDGEFYYISASKSGFITKEVINE